MKIKWQAGHWKEGIAKLSQEKKKKPGKLPTATDPRLNISK